MTEELSNLLRDPLFQLNVLLWLSQELPFGYDIKPFTFNTVSI